MLVLDMIEILPPLEKYKYDTWRILSVKCYIDNSMRLRSCIRNINTPTPSYVLQPSDDGTGPPARHCLVPSLQWAVAPFWGM
jgi:hypothetical protein